MYLHRLENWLYKFTLPLEDSNAWLKSVQIYKGDLHSDTVGEQFLFMLLTEVTINILKCHHSVSSLLKQFCTQPVQEVSRTNFLPKEHYDFLRKTGGRDGL